MIRGTTAQFKFKLPEEQIAQYPCAYEYDADGNIVKRVEGFDAHRDECRLMVLHAKSNRIEHKIFKELIEYFGDKDLFVFNDTQVFPALMHGNKEKTNALIEVFLLRELNQQYRLWDVLVEPARKIRVGNKLYFVNNSYSSKYESSDYSKYTVYMRYENNVNKTFILEEKTQAHRKQHNES